MASLALPRMDDASPNDELSLASTPQHSQQQADAGRDQHRFHGLFANVPFQVLLELHRLFAALLVILGRLLATLLVVFRGRVADLADLLGRRLLGLLSDIAQALADLLRLFLELIHCTLLSGVLDA